MAKQDFIENVRLARNLLVHRVEADNPALDTDATARRLYRAALWLTPASVRGFDPADFSELSEAARAELERNVREFRDVAERVPDDGHVTEDQVATALPRLLAIARILQPFVGPPYELDQLRAAMRKVRFPPDVVETWYPEFGVDSSGDPAVWIWLVVDDAVADDPTMTATTSQLQREIRQSLRRAGLNRWPYVRLRTVSEQKSLQAVGQ